MVWVGQVVGVVVVVQRGHPQCGVVGVVVVVHTRVVLDVHDITVVCRGDRHTLITVLAGEYGSVGVAPQQMLD